MLSRTGTTPIIFGYNGRDGVVTDANGLIYMRARYYSPEMRRFINADIIPGEISNAITLNRFAYANGNPVSNIDPFGLEAERGNNKYYVGNMTAEEMQLEIDEIFAENEIKYGSDEYIDIWCQLVKVGTDGYSHLKDTKEFINVLKLIDGKVKFVRKGDYIIIKGNRDVLAEYGIKQTRIRADNIKKFQGIDDLYKSQTFKGAFKNAFNAPGVILDAVGIAANTIYEVNQYESVEDKRIIGTYTVGTGIITTVASATASAGATAVATKIGMATGSFIAPGVGTAIGLGVGFIVGIILDGVFGWIRNNYIEDIMESN